MMGKGRSGAGEGLWNCRSEEVVGRRVKTFGAPYTAQDEELLQQQRDRMSAARRTLSRSTNREEEEKADN